MISMALTEAPPPGESYLKHLHVVAEEEDPRGAHSR